MNVRRITRWCTLTALVAVGTTIGLNQHRRRTTGVGRRSGRGGSAHARAGARGLCRNNHFRSGAGHRGRRKRRRPPSKKCRRNRDRRGPTSPGSPATGAGTTSGTISCGSAASGAPCRQVANGCPGIGASRGKAFNGLPDTGPMQRPARLNTCPSRRRRSKRSQHCRAFGGRHLVARLLGLAAEPLRLAPWLLGDREAGLGLGARPLRVDPPRLRLRRWLLGLLGSASRRPVCAGLFRCGVSAPSAVSPTRRRR